MDKHPLILDNRSRTVAEYLHHSLPDAEVFRLVSAYVVISIADPPPDRTLKALRATAGAWKGTHDPEALKQSLNSQIQ